ncbi:MAG: Stp1/IreP family PP2C-type Ser/Thr phosphatase [Terracidiphilus sp.]
MSTAVVHYAAAALTDRGRKRPSNEDAVGYSVEHGVYIVCDGMGGAAAGEVASQQAVDEMLAALGNAPAGEDAPSLEEAADQAICATNESIYARARRNPHLSGMGTTLVGLLVRGGELLVVNVGDSRCYRLRQQRLEQITLDHSLVEEQVRLGRMTPAEALRSPLRNVITRALGTQNSVTADFFHLEPEPGDLFLLCSDGLTRELKDAQIEAILLGDPALDGLCRHLVEAAKKAGGQDNITCLVVRVEA